MSIAMKSCRLLLALACMMTFVSRARAGEDAKDLLELDPQKFGDSTKIDNKWWPLVPGTRHVYDGFSVEDGEQVRHSVVEIVTDLTKVVAGVRVVVNLEEDYSEGKLEERELAFHAQDKEGNIWHLGQLRETYDGQEFVGGRVWYAGQPQGAKAGIRMWANPKVGVAASQGFAPPPFHWTDRGRVFQMGEKVKAAAGNYDNVLVVEEWDEETPEGVFQTKYYAPGVGIVKIGFRGQDPEQEELDLVKTEHLDAAGLAKVRSIALAIEKRAYMYSHTPPAEPINVQPAVK